MTDGLITDQIQHNLILKEKDKYKDIKLQPLKGGRGQFGFRFLDQIKWAAAGAHQMEPPSSIQAPGVNPFPSRFIIRTVPRGDFARRRWEEPITTTK